MKRGQLMIICLLLASILSSTPGAAKKHRKYLASDDSTAIYSKHPSRPFKYGYAYTRHEAEKYFASDLSAFGIRNGEIVADVGAASGWNEGLLSVFCDSVTFYIQDIDTNFANEEQLAKVVKYYSSLRNTPQTNSFSLVIGKNTETRLPDKKFDKILVINTLHEVKAAQKLINDLADKIKDDGKILVMDWFSNRYRKITHKGCNLVAQRPDALISKFYRAHLYLTGMTQPENSFINILTFEKNRQHADSFYTQRKIYRFITEELDRLNETLVSRDSIATQRIGDFLAHNLPILQTVFKPITHYLNFLIEVLVDNGDIVSEYNVAKLTFRLFPHMPASHENLILALADLNQYEKALEAAERASRQFPDEENLKLIILELKNTIDSIENAN